jgi:hypothetical protein
VAEPKPTWVIDEVLYLCREIEAIAPEYGCHVALTGGLLYKDGPRKDADILLYRIREDEYIDVAGLFGELSKKLEIVRKTPDDVWCVKATWRGKSIDFFFPEAEEGEYPEEEDDDAEKDDGLDWQALADGGAEGADDVGF